MRNVYIEGLDRFIVNQATLNEDSLRYSFDFTVPDTVANFWYDLAGDVFSLIPIFGTGNARMAPISKFEQIYIFFNQKNLFLLNFSDLSISGHADLVTDGNNFVQLSDLVIRIRLQDLEVLFFNQLFCF